MTTTLAPQLTAALGPGYQLERELLGGGMSRVFVALEKALGRRVVVKVLSPDLAAGVNRERFQREIQFAAQLQHPHIVPLLAAGEHGDLLWYTMPVIEGESLRKALERGERFSVRDVLRILREVADALAYAHERGVVHRDIKPANILAQQNHAVVTDFGVAKALTVAMPDAGLTTAGMAIGTPEYMAPEQLAGDPTADARVDLYALGLLVYELLAGKSPFGGLSPRATLAAQLTQDPPPLSGVRPDVPPSLVSLVSRCLAKDPAERIQSARQILAELDGHTSAPITAPTGLADAPTTLVVTGPTAVAAPAARRDRSLIALVAALVLVSSVAVGQFALGRRADAIARADSLRSDSANKASAAAAATLAAAAPQEQTLQLTPQELAAMIDSITNARDEARLAEEKRKGMTVDSTKQAAARQATRDSVQSALTTPSRGGMPRILRRRLFVLGPPAARGADSSAARAGRGVAANVVMLRAAADSLRVAAGQLRAFQLMPPESTVVRTQYFDVNGFHPNDLVAQVLLPSGPGAPGVGRQNQPPRGDSVALKVSITEFKGGPPDASGKPAETVTTDLLARAGRNAPVGVSLQGRAVPRPALLTTVPDLVKRAILTLDSIGRGRGRRGGQGGLVPRGG